MNIACPICHTEESSQFYEVDSDGKNYSVETCRHCSHHYTSFSFEVDPELLYNDEVYRVVDNRDSIYSKIMDREYSKVLKQLTRLYPEGSELLDFGAGKGVFLNLAQRAGFRCTGVETAEARADFAEEKYGVEIVRAFYTGGPVARGRFDVITLFHVLEHLPAPKELLKSLIADNLKEGGMLILEVPNLSGWQAAFARNKWMHLDIPRHLSHFTEKRLVEFCSELNLNLKIVRREYFSLHLGILGMCQSLLSLLGYQGKIIRDLKHYNVKLLLALIPVLPVAFVLEIIAALCRRGGVIRLYCRRDV